MRRGDHGELTATARAHEMTPQRLWQQRQVRAGNCARCGGERKRYAWFCDTCQAADTVHSRARVERLYDEGLCRCGQPRGDHRRCETCRERERLARAAARHRAR